MNTTRWDALPPQAVADLYLACARAHNRPDMRPDARREEVVRMDAILDVVRVTWGATAAGWIIGLADEVEGGLANGWPMCGGRRMDLEVS